MRYNEFKLAEGLFDPAVKKVQEFLISKGYNLGPTGADGINGPYTKAAVAKFLSLQKPNSTTTDKPTTPTQPTTAPTTVDKPAGGSTLPSGDVMPTKGTISGHYGRTVTGPNGNKIPHPGVDIAAPEGTPIVAPDGGTIKYAGWGNTAGNLVELITDDGVKHRFMHLSKILVKTNDSVKKGQTVGLVGNTGFSRGAHLHWEKYASGKQLNPIAE
jgi:murein DD-endopeptidase MepM/ murein hydrolase activator NlpD